ncbi:MAG TPA: putative toxin-antitoxin system toxin component, PIN family [Bacteroidia bacterium]|nr:putative toxin-antitoxin system toxin component, PIN family [Bacteroidia bacterium]
MTVCIDTNTLVQARVPTHPHSPILEAAVFGRIHWAISNRILTEYEEIICRCAGHHEWSRLLRLIELADAITGSVVWISPHYQFHVIGTDPDDNAFTDCAIAAHADYVITEDKHFAPLADAGYKPQPITPHEFIAKHGGMGQI